MASSQNKPRPRPSFHDLAGHGDQMQRDFLVAHEVVGSGRLDDERGAARRDDGVVGDEGGDAPAETPPFLFW